MDGVWLPLGRNMVYSYRYSLGGVIGNIPACAAVYNLFAFDTQAAFSKRNIADCSLPLWSAGAYGQLSHQLSLAALPTRHLDAPKSHLGALHVE